MYNWYLLLGGHRVSMPGDYYIISSCTLARVVLLCSRDDTAHLERIVGVTIFDFAVASSKVYRWQPCRHQAIFSGGHSDLVGFTVILRVCGVISSARNFSLPKAWQNMMMIREL